MSAISTARPIQAALASAANFPAGAAMPLLIAAVAPHTMLVAVEAVASLLFLGLLGVIDARAGGVSVSKATLCVRLDSRTSRIMLAMGLQAATTAGHGLRL